MTLQTLITDTLISHPAIPSSDTGTGWRCPSCPGAVVYGPNSPTHAEHQAAALLDLLPRCYSREDEPLGDLAQCGRTRVHRRHETTEGWCPGLDGTEVPPPLGLLSRLRSALTGGGA